eukprot:gene8251-8335_t
MAADLPKTQSPPVPQPDILPPPTSQDQFTWTGLYGGLQDGLAVSRTPFDFSDGTSARQGGDGALIGLRAGYNYDIGNSLVVGVETDVNGSFIKGDKECVGSTANCSHKIQSFGALDGRFGYVQDRFLLSASAGVAYAQAKFTTTPYNGYAAVATGHTSRTLLGFTLGAGVDYAVTDHILMSIGYKYYNFNKKTVAAGVLDTNTVSVRPTMNVVTTGVSYKF